MPISPLTAARIFDGGADFFGDRPAAAEHPLRFRDVQPALVDAERLHAVGVPLVDFAHLLGYAKVGGKIGGELYQVRAFLLRPPKHVARLDARFLGGLIFGEHDAVPVLLAPAHGDGFAAQFGVLEHLHRRVKIVEVAVQDAPHLSRSTNQRFSASSK